MGVSLGMVRRVPTPPNLARSLGPLVRRESATQPGVVRVLCDYIPEEDEARLVVVTDENHWTIPGFSAWLAGLELSVFQVAPSVHATTIALWEKDLGNLGAYVSESRAGVLYERNGRAHRQG